MSHSFSSLNKKYTKKLPKGARFHRKSSVKPSEAQFNTLTTLLILLVLQAIIFLISHSLHILSTLQRIFYSEQVPLLGEKEILVRHLFMDWIWLATMLILALLVFQFDQRVHRVSWAYIYIGLSLLSIGFFFWDLVAHVTRFYMIRELYYFPWLYYVQVGVQSAVAGLSIAGFYPFWVLLRFMRKRSSTLRMKKQ